MPHIDQVDNSMADLQSLPNLREETDQQLQQSTHDIDIAPANVTLTETPDLTDTPPLPPPTKRSKSKSKSRSRSQSKELEFVSSHFKESSEEAEDENDDLAAGLDLPDFDESVRAEEEERREQQESTTQALFLAAALQNSQVVTDMASNMASNLMSTTLSGLSTLKQTVMPAETPAPSTQMADSGGEVVDAEFEFLSQEDLEDSLHEEGITKE